MNSHYSEKDSIEVRRHLSKCLHEQGGERQPVICTQAEHDKFEEAGCDMSEYMTIQQMEKIVRAEALKEMKNKRIVFLNRKTG